MTVPTALALCLAFGLLTALDMPARAAGPDAGDGSLASLDASGDGAVDRGEWEAASAARFAELDGNGDGKLSAVEIAMIPVPPGPSADRLRDSRQRQYQAMDANGDGLVDRKEYVDVGLGRFQALDRDGDGRITAEDLRPSGSRRGQ